MVHNNYIRTYYKHQEPEIQTLMLISQMLVLAGKRTRPPSIAKSDLLTTSSLGQLSSIKVL